MAPFRAYDTLEQRKTTCKTARLTKRSHRTYRTDPLLDNLRRIK